VHAPGKDNSFEERNRKNNSGILPLDTLRLESSLGSCLSIVDKQKFQGGRTVAGSERSSIRVTRGKGG